MDQLWNVVYWISFLNMWFIIPLVQGYYDCGGFTFKQKFVASLKFNAIFFAVAGVVFGVLLLYLVFAQHLTLTSISGILVCASNTWGLIMIVVALGYGLADIPRQLWYQGNRKVRLRQIRLRAAGVHAEMQEARDELEQTRALVNKFDNKISDDHAYRTYMDQIVEAMRDQTLEVGRGGGGRYSNRVENSVLQSLSSLDPRTATLDELQKLHYHVKCTARRSALLEATWQNVCDEAFQLEKYLEYEEEGASAAPSFSVNFREALHFHFVAFWQTKAFRVAAVLCMLMSLMMLWCEITIIFKNVNLSIFGLMVARANSSSNLLGLQLATLFPLLYLAACCYYPTFILRIGNFYYVGIRRTDENSIMFNVTLLLRMSAPLAYNFARLLRIDEAALLNLIGQMEVVPFFGRSFNDIFPWFILIFFVLTLLDAYKQIFRILRVGQYTLDQDQEDAEKEGATFIKFERRRRATPEEREQSRRKEREAGASKKKSKKKKSSRRRDEEEEEDSGAESV